LHGSWAGCGWLAAGIFPWGKATKVGKLGKALDEAGEAGKAGKAADAAAHARLADSGFVNPMRVRFSQNSISPTFKDGRSVQGLADDLASGAVSPSDVPAIRLVERNGTYFTLDNRRLEAFQRAGLDVPYRLATPEEITREGWKFTTTNDGTSILIRGGG
jgi:hypothetical protein